MITKTEVFDALADIQRRRLLLRLLDSDTQTVPQLSSTSQEMLQAHEDVLQEYLSGTETIADADKADIRTHHVHLPKLVEFLYVEWDRDDHLVTKGPKYDDLRPLLEVVNERRDEQRIEETPRTVVGSNNK